MVGGGNWGGLCQCPNGQKYFVGEANAGYVDHTGSNCTNLHCKGGKKLYCFKKNGRWTNKKVICDYAKNKVNLAPKENVYSTKGGGGWGGECQCPDGKKYWVGDHAPWYCRKLACHGGKKLSCYHKTDKKWSNKSVMCSPGRSATKHCRCQPCPKGAMCNKMCLRECWDEIHKKWTGRGGKTIVIGGGAKKESYHHCMIRTRDFCKRVRPHCPRGKASRGQCCNHTQYCKRVVRGGHAINKWWNKGSKNTTWNRHRHGMKNIRQVMAEMTKKCNHKFHDKHYCAWKTKQGRSKALKEIHQNNWKYNILRWGHKLSKKDYRHRLAMIRKRMHQWHRKPKEIQQEVKEFLQAHGKERAEWHRNDKKKYDKLKQTLARRLRYMNTYHGWKTYSKQQANWQKSPVGRCLKERIEHHNWIKRHARTLTDRQVRDGLKNVDKHCSRVGAHWLPFANHNCMSLLDIEYGIAVRQEVQFLRRENDETLHKFEGALKKGKHILRRNCLNGNFTHHAPHCKNYLFEKLRTDSNRLNQRKGEQSTKRFMGNLMNDFQRIYDTLMDERFWLNAPKDCRIGSVDGGNHHIKDEGNKDMNWLDKIKDTVFSHENVKKFKQTTNWVWKRMERHDDPHWHHHH